MPENESDLRLSEGFPSIPKGCETVANNFFSCFFENIKKAGPDELEPGLIGLRACVDKKDLYESCLATKKPSLRTYRVRLFSVDS